MSALKLDALQQSTRGLEHHGEHYTIDKIGEQEWKVTDAGGRYIGRLELRSEAGEGGEPVFAVFAPVSDSIYMEGSDWESLVRALINDNES